MVVEQTRRIRTRLRYAWGPFFSRFGRLTPIQIEVIPKILNGSNVIAASPTASGKTEAIVAPVAQKFIEENWSGLAVVYVVPTRALANDTIARIGEPLQDMNIKADLKHGDQPYFSLSNAPNFLVTTPETLDSLICRHSQVFSNLRTVVIDEIHVLDNTYRGDQLRLLLWRLRRVANNDALFVHLLSATLFSPFETALRYVRPCEVITIPGSREIDYKFLKSQQEVYDYAWDQNWRKVLYFCNLRESVETLASEISNLWRPYPVVAHHGSLGRHFREEAERVMKESRVAVCVATSTMEFGIDIGDIDLIVLVEPPWSISSLLQRIGRGNRREDVTHVVALFDSLEEREHLECMFTAAISGELPEEPYIPDLSVAVQQIFSYLYQNVVGVPNATIMELFSPICSEEEAVLILIHLQEKGWIERRAEKWFASENLMNLGEKGRIHSNIPDSQSYRVVDASSNKEIGSVMGIVDEIFVLAGRIWKVVSVDDTIIKVRYFAGKASTAYFRRLGRSRIGSFYRFLHPVLRRSFQEL